MNTIYIITAVGTFLPTNGNNGIHAMGRQRNVGWLPTLTEASTMIVNNEGNIYDDGLYNYCVVEEVLVGVPPSVDKEWWFEWIGGYFYPITKKPKKLEGLHNFCGMEDRRTI